MSNDKRIAYLFSRALQEQLTAEEAAELGVWLNQSAANRRIYEEQVLEGKAITRHLELQASFNQERVRQAAREFTAQHGAKLDSTYRFHWRTLAAAAAIGLVIFSSWYYLHSTNGKELVQTNKPADGDIAPGRSRATLILANHTVIDLDTASNGEIASQGSARLMKTSTGKLEYMPSGTGESSQAGPSTAAYNILRTPIAGQYELTLPDGTKVWLNNASELRYPANFSANNRTVELTGEGYFEVKQDPSRPFVVRVGGQTIQVLGTAFNITAYPEKLIVRTVLVTGSVKVNWQASSTILKPGSQTENRGDGLITQQANVRSVTAWMKGFFNFSNSPVDEVFTQLARWYGIRVSYPNGVPDKQLSGRIDRNRSFSEVIKLLESYEIQCDVNGTEVTVTEKKK